MLDQLRLGHRAEHLGGAVSGGERLAAAVVAAAVAAAARHGGGGHEENGGGACALHSSRSSGSNTSRNWSTDAKRIGTYRAGGSLWRARAGARGVRGEGRGRGTLATV